MFIKHQKIYPSLFQGLSTSGGGMREGGGLLPHGGGGGGGEGGQHCQENRRSLINLEQTQAS